MTRPKLYDVFIIGSGAAGLSLALSLADTARVAIISKDDLGAGSSQYAQGGIAAVLDKTTENIELHITDTLRTGAGRCNQETVHFVVNEAKAAIEWLIAHGVQFTLDPSTRAFHLTKEGGHSQRRILHTEDRTGAAIVHTLIDQVFRHPGIDCYSQHTAIDLMIEQGQCVGARVLNNQTAEIIPFTAKETILACGGASRVYLHSTNPDVTSGDGIAMAYRVGARISNMAFNQFHPTCFYQPGEKPFLISEALRGEGATLRLPNGEQFMKKYDPRGALAPRDTVSRAIHQELQQNKINYVHLDATMISSEKIKSHFPTIYDYCLNQHIDITRQPIPVVPAAHYTCGGVDTDLQGQTSIPHLYAIGEAAHTGLHGANRMASNSLLECIVFAASAGRAIQQALSKNNYVTPPNQPSNIPHVNPSIEINQSTKELQTLMWNHVGIVRNNAGLTFAKQKIAEHQNQLSDTKPNQKSSLTKSFLEYRNLVTCAELITDAAISEKENCGLHYNSEAVEA